MLPEGHWVDVDFELSKRGKFDVLHSGFDEGLEIERLGIVNHDAVTKPFANVEDGGGYWSQNINLF